MTDRELHGLFDGREKPEPKMRPPRYQSSPRSQRLGDATLDSMVRVYPRKSPSFIAAVDEIIGTSQENNHSVKVKRLNSGEITFLGAGTCAEVIRS